MKRTLRRGSTYCAPDGVIYSRTVKDERVGKERYPAGMVRVCTGGTTRRISCADFEISEEAFAHDPSLWEPTPEETRTAVERKMAREAEWWKARGKDGIPREVMDNHFKAEAKILAGAPADKEMQGSESDPTPAKRGPGRPRVENK